MAVAWADGEDERLDEEAAPVADDGLPLCTADVDELELFEEPTSVVLPFAPKPDARQSCPWIA